MEHGKENAHREPLAELRELLESYRADIWTVVSYAVGVGLLALATPIAVQSLVDTAAFGTVLQPVLVLVLLLLLGLAFASLLKALKTWAVEVLQRRMFVDTVAQLAHRLPRAEAGASSTAGRGHLVHRFFDLFTVQKAAASLLLSGIDVVLATSVGMLVLAFYHPILLAFAISLGVGLAMVIFVLGRGGVRTSIEESTIKYEIAGFLAELGRANYAFRDGGGNAYAHERLDSLAQSYLRSRAGHFRVVMRQFAGALTLQAVASAGLLGLGGFLVIERELTLGQLVAAELIVTTVVSTLSDLGKHVETYYDLVTGVHKLRSLTSVPVEEEEQAEREEIASGPATLAVRDLDVTVGERALFEGAELNVDRGARVSLVGPAETGKTYLLELLFGMRRAQRGRISIDGIDVRELSRRALRERVAIVRGPEIVPGTIIDNVRLARRGISAGRVRSLLEELGLTEELGRLPDGLDTVLGPGGAVLSDSQAWRLTVARAIAREPGLVAIDADLSSIDAFNLERVLQVLSRPEAPWTLIVVSGDAQVQKHCTDVVHVRGHRFTREVLT